MPLLLLPLGLVGEIVWLGEVGAVLVPLDGELPLEPFEMDEEAEPGVFPVLVDVAGDTIPDPLPLELGMEDGFPEALPELVEVGGERLPGDPPKEVIVGPSLGALDVGPSLAADDWVLEGVLLVVGKGNEWLVVDV